MPGARESAMEALRLDPALAKAHASLGLVRYLYEWSFAEAEESFEKAIALDPGYPSAHHWFAMMLMATGRYDESLAQIDRAIALEPESALYDVKRGTILMAAGRLDEAEAHLRSVLERRPESPLARRELGLLELVRGRPEARAAYLDSSEPAYALVLGRLGRKSEARAMLEALRDVESSAYVSPVDFALVHVGSRRETEAALDELERAFEGKDAALVYLRTQPGLASASLRSALPGPLEAHGTLRWNDEKARDSVPRSRSGRRRPRSVRFAVSFPAERSREPLDGRLLLLISNDPSAEPRFQILTGPKTQLVFGIDVEGMGAGERRRSSTRASSGIPSTASATFRKAVTASRRSSTATRPSTARMDTW